MNLAATAPQQSTVIDLVLQAYELAEAGKHGDALATIKTAKVADPRNIYIIALEKQFTKLLSLPRNGDAARSQQKEIMDTLPSLLERAIDGARQRSEVARTASPPPANDKEKEARLQAVKNQYFRRADEYLERGEYQNALSEVKRVSIVDPGNRVAKEYEAKIQQLSMLQAKNSGAAAPETVSTNPAVEVAEPVPVQAPVERHEPSAPSKKSPVMMIAAVVAVALLLVAGVFFVMNRPDEGQESLAGQAVQQPAEESPSGNGTAAGQTAAHEQLPQAVSQPSVSPAIRVPAVAEKPKEEKKTEQITPRETVQKPPDRTPVLTQTSPAVQNLTPEKEAAPPVAPPIAAATPAGTGTSSQAEVPPAEQFVAVQKEPQIVKLEKPKLPEAVLRMGAKGKVVVKVQVDAQGKALQAVILSSSNTMLNDAVIEAVMDSKYLPGVMSKGPVTTWLAIPFSFK